MHKWLDDVAVQQVALMIWEMSKKTNIAIQMLFLYNIWYILNVRHL